MRFAFIKSFWVLLTPETLIAPLWLWLRALGPTALAVALAFFGLQQWAIPIFVLGVFPLVMHPYHEFCKWLSAGLNGHAFIPINRRDKLDQARHETDARLVQ